MVSLGFLAVEGRQALFHAVALSAALSGQTPGRSAGRGRQEKEKDRAF